MDWASIVIGLIGLVAIGGIIVFSIKKNKVRKDKPKDCI
jgi:LPXTG-motif cell wall-anchored protein